MGTFTRFIHRWGAALGSRGRMLLVAGEAMMGVFIRFIYRWGLVLGPRGCVLLIAGVDWIIEGIGVLRHLDGRITDAPDIHYMPATLRGSLWILSGTIAIAAALRREWGHIGAAILFLMPLVRVTSYMIAWAISFPLISRFFEGSSISGYKDGWYYTGGSFRAVAIALFATWAPIAWSDYDRVHGREVLTRSKCKKKSGG